MDKMGKECELNKKQLKMQWTDILYGVVLLLGWATLSFLFFRQIVAFGGRYESDTQYYVELARANEGDRLISYVFRVLCKLPESNYFIAIYMGAVVVLTIIVNYLIIKEFTRKDGITVPRSASQLASLVMIAVGSIYVPLIHPIFYKNCWTTYAWHSPTQQTMMLFSLIAIAAFSYLYEHYFEKLEIGVWLVLMLSGVLATWSKPSYIMVMTPTVIILFIIELIKSDRSELWARIRKLFVLGCAFIPSGLLAIYLNSLYFGDGRDAEGGNIAFGLERFLSNGMKYHVLNIVCGMLIPIIIYAFNHGRFREKKYKLALVMLLASVIEWMFIYETGSRAAHGNFSWGKKLGCYYFYLCTITLFLENIFDKSFLSDRGNRRKLYIGVVVVLFALMLISQAYYFYAVLKGHTYRF